jgi:hypothetical protein
MASCGQYYNCQRYQDYLNNRLNGCNAHGHSGYTQFECLSFVKKFAEEKMKTETKYPFELVGDAVYLNGLWLKEISTEKEVVFDKMAVYVTDSLSNDTKLIDRAYLRAVLKLMRPFVCFDRSFRKAWVEVDPPEPKTITRPMNADEVATLGAIWIRLSGSNEKLFMNTMTLERNGEISFSGRLISHWFYAYSSTSTEWLPFTITEVVK